MPNFTLNVAMSTHSGLVRDHNEDAIGYHYPVDFDILTAKGALFVLADGVGGLPGGEKASHYVVERLIELYYASPPGISIKETLCANLEQINSEVYQNFEQHLATTVVALVIRGDEVTTAYAGDSRAYRYDGSSIQQYTDDHVIEVVDRRNRRKTRLTRAIGYVSEIRLDVIEDKVAASQGFLMMSDGVVPYFNEDDLLTLMSETPRDIVTDIIQYSVQGGGHDNISAIMIAIGEPLADETALRRHVQKMTKQGISLEVADYPQIQPLYDSHNQLRWRLFFLSIVILVTLILSLLLFVNEANQGRFAVITQLPAAATPQ